MRIGESGGLHHGLEPVDEAMPEPADGEPAGPTPPAEPAPLNGLLNLLPPAPFAAAFSTFSAASTAAFPAPPAAAVTPAPTPATPTPAAAPAATSPASTYQGEPAVSIAWLAQREAALQGLRADHEAARQQAIASAGQGPGWAPAHDLYTDEAGQTHSASNAPLVFVSEAEVHAELIGWDEGGDVYRYTSGQWLAFNDEAFAQHYRAQAGPALQALAASYNTDAATLLTQHPGLWSIATQDHALNAGPPPAPGLAMGDAQSLGTLDLYLADPQINALIGAFGGPAAPARSGLAQEQARLYGQARSEQLSRLTQAMQAVRDHYAEALNQARYAGTGPGWVDLPQGPKPRDEGGEQPRNTVDENGQPLPATYRSFDPDAFTAWYTAQDGLRHQAFADFFGQSQTQFGFDETGQPFATTTRFDNADWSMSGGLMQHATLQSLDLNHAPRLNDEQAVVFDLQAGWATPHDNLHQDRSWLETVVKVGIVAAVAYVSAGSAGPNAAAAMGLTTTGATTLTGATALTATGLVVSAAVVGAATSLASGVLNDNLSFKNVLRGALAGALTAGLMDTLAPLATQAAGAAGGALLRGTVQGGVQALLGGQFKDGAIAGVAAGLADLATANLKAGIDQALATGGLSAEQAIAAREFTRVIGSAIRIVGNPDDPGAAFAGAFLGDLMNEFGQVSAPLPNTTPGYRNGADLESDNAHQAARDQQWIDQSDQILARRSEPDAALSPPQADVAGAGRPDPFALAQGTATVSDTFDDGWGQFKHRDPMLRPVGWGDDAQRSWEVLRGFAEGSGMSLLSIGEALLDVVSNPRAFVAGMKALFASPEARAQFGADLVAKVQTDLRLLEDAWNGGDLRGTGQMLGKLVTDASQVAGGVEALARLGVGTASAGGRLLYGAVEVMGDKALRSIPALFDATGNALMDFRALTNAQKAVIGETLGEGLVKQLVPDGISIGRAQTVGSNGIDALFKVSRSDVDYVIVEYKFGSSPLANSIDGLQMSDSWLHGAVTGESRLVNAVGEAEALDIAVAMGTGRTEKWLVHTNQAGDVAIYIVDKDGKLLLQPKSALIGGKP